MKVVRVMARLALLSLAAAAFVGLTDMYGRSVRLPLPDPHDRAVRGHRTSGPETGNFPEYLAEVITLAIYAGAGRIVFRLRLSPVSASSRQSVVLNLDDPKPAKA